uniref:Nucleoporin 35 n=1 Tax=Astyanax mexicanus TaxID=7994 RepID=A0A8B9HNV2_ASTMX
MSVDVVMVQSLPRGTFCKEGFSRFEPMALGSPTSPKPGPGAQFLPGFLMGDLPAPTTPLPRTISLSGGGAEMRSPLLAGGSPPQPVVPTPKDKSGAPPVRSIYDDLTSPGIAMSPLASCKQPYSVLHTPLAGVMGTPGTGEGLSVTSIPSRCIVTF